MSPLPFCFVFRPAERYRVADHLIGWASQIAIKNSVLILVFSEASNEQEGIFFLFSIASLGRSGWRSKGYSFWCLHKTCFTLPRLTNTSNKNTCKTACTVMVPARVYRLQFSCQGNYKVYINFSKMQSVEKVQWWLNWEWKWSLMNPQKCAEAQ